MPAYDGHLHALAKLVEALELVVDQRLERADIENRQPWRCSPIDQCEDRKEGRFGLAGGGRSRDDDVTIALHDRADRLGLDIPQARPALFADPAPDLRIEAVIGIHRLRT